MTRHGLLTSLLSVAISGLALLCGGTPLHAQGILLEAEAFSDRGGWVVDQQFMDRMGSSYLLAHGCGVPVAPASTSFTIADAGEYHVYVRTYNWTSPWAPSKKGPGAFCIGIDGESVSGELGTEGAEWHWQYAGKAKLSSGSHALTVTDLTGFEGRFDAIYITPSKEDVPPGGAAELAVFRKTLSGMGESQRQEYDFVVVGGGVAGMCAAVAAARGGAKVALVNDRPVLGGNNSSEVRVHLGGYSEIGPYPALGRLLAEFGHTLKGNAQPASNYEDGRKADFIAAEPGVTLLAPYHAVAVSCDGSRISGVTVKHIETSQEITLSAPLFADCTGDGTIGFLAGADFAVGRESREEYGESLAPEKADNRVMGASVQWYSSKEDSLVDFPEFSYGIDFTDESCEKVTMGEWTWETGMAYDQVEDAERIRDYGMLVIYSNWSHLKNHSQWKENYASRRLDWVAYIAGKRESRRLLGDHILTQRDIDEAVPYDDASYTTTWAIDLHFPDNRNSRYFPGEEFKAATVHNWICPYAVPYRTLYSRNISNLFMAGRDASVSHVGLGTVRVMRTTAMMGEVVGLAERVCRRHSCSPREVYTLYLDELKALMTEGAGRKDAPYYDQRFNLPNILLPAPRARLSEEYGSCFGTFAGDSLVIGNSLIRRSFIWNGGNLRTRSLTDVAAGITRKTASGAPDCNLPFGENGKGEDGTLEYIEVPATALHPQYLVVRVETTLGGVRLRREFRMYDNAPAIACDTYLRLLPGCSAPLEEVSSGASDNASERTNIESRQAMKIKASDLRLDRLSFAGKHWHARAVEFADITDWHDNLVWSRDIISYHRITLRGNLLLARNAEDGCGFFFLKEAPGSSSQLAYPGADFVADYGTFSVTGAGFSAPDLREEDWTRAYGCVTGVFQKGELSALTALRQYQKQLRLAPDGRDEMVMMNTWGDRSRDTKVNEEFCLHELELASKLGINVFQIDDGWQEGKSANSAYGGSFKNIWDNPEYWTPSREKYPRGLAPVVARADSLGIRVGLWFNPSVQDNFADWEKDAEAILKLYREYGIKIFKIDGLSVPNKVAENRLRSLFDRIGEESGGEILINLDVTAGRRPGYHCFNAYGNIFLENRYTDWQNYYPYRTLRNLWQLSRYVPAEKIQVEFLNKWRNAESYGSDTFAPAGYDFEYLFAQTLAGQPLAWLEASNLPEEAFSIAPAVEKWREISQDFHSGIILPAGDEPSGASWTGFQSITGEKSGYLLVFREGNEDSDCSFQTFLPTGAKASLVRIMGTGGSAKVNAKVDSCGRIPLVMKAKNTYALYSYTIK